MSQRVCIVNREAVQEELVTLVELQIAGFKIRLSTVCASDLILSCDGTTVAFLLLRHDGSTQPSTSFWNRVTKLAQTFRQAFVLVAALQSSITDTALVEAAARYCGRPSFVTVVAGVSLTDRAMRILQALVGTNTLELCQQGVEAYKLALRTIASAQLTDYNLNALRLIGSLQEVAASTEDELLNNTDLDPLQARQLEAFFREQPGV